MCTIKSCKQANTTLYENREDWWAHELQVHRKVWCCNIDGHDIFTEETLFFKHMHEQHRGLTDRVEWSGLTALYGWPIDRATSASEETSALSAPHLQSHLARHLEDLALRVLPNSESEKLED